MTRPTEWIGEKKQKAIEDILTQLSIGKSIRQILDNNDELPSRKTFYEWLASDTQLSNHYANMCEVRADIIFDEMIDIADETSNDTVITEIGEKPNTEWISRSRLRIDTRKWILSKMNPKKYGDKTDITTNGKEINIPIIEWVKSNENSED
jgi:hypothetical protein